MKVKKIYLIIFSAFLIGVMLGAVFVVAQTPSSPFSVSPGVYPGAPSFTVWREGNYYFAKDANGELKYSDSNFTALISRCLDNMPMYGGRILLRTGYYEGWVVIDRDGIILEGEGVYSDVPEGIPDHSPTALYGSVIKVTTEGKHGIEIKGQRFGIQIRNLGIWFTQPSTGCGITTSMTQTYTLTHFVIENIKILNCDKDSYAIRLSNFLHGNVRAIMAFGGPLLELYANKPNFHQGNSIFDELYGYIKYDLSPIDFWTGPYPIFIHKNDSIGVETPTLTNLINMRRIQINNPIGQTDPDYYSVVLWDLRYSTIANLDIEGVNNGSLLMGSCMCVTLDQPYLWTMDPGDSRLNIASDNQYITVKNGFLEYVEAFNHTVSFQNCYIAGTIHANTVAGFEGLSGNQGFSFIPANAYSVVVSARFIGPSDYILLTVIDDSNHYVGVKVEQINRAPTNTFVVKRTSETTLSEPYEFYWEVRHRYG